MNAGDLRKIITIEAPTAEQDEDGQDIPTWSTVAGPLWASIRTLSGRQLALAQANTVTATSSHAVTIRYRTGVTETQRVKYDPAGVTFATMTDEEYAALTDAQYAALVSDSDLTPRYFQIDAIADEWERHRQLVLTCTEVRA